MSSGTAGVSQGRFKGMQIKPGMRLASTACDTNVIVVRGSGDLDIRCVRVQPYELGGRLLVNIEQVIPLRAAILASTNAAAITSENQSS